MAHTTPLEEGHKPPFITIYRLFLLVIEEAKRQNIHKRWIETSSSPHELPVLFVEKKDGGLTMVIDYRSSNKLTIKSQYWPKIDDIFYQFVYSRVFNSLNLAQSCHQIQISVENVPKIEFRVPFGH